MKLRIFLSLLTLVLVVPSNSFAIINIGDAVGDKVYRNEVGTYYYDLNGGGFSKFIDLEGNDWISFKNSGGSDGRYRGIPNLVHTPNDSAKSFFHPGYSNATSTGIITGNGIESFKTTSSDGKWETIWEIHPTFVKMEVTTIDSSRQYWFLYEGTPGGLLEPATDMYATSSNPNLTPMTTEFTADLKDPEWIYFVDPNASYGLVLFNDTADYDIDSYYPMNGEMTVFGFGRNKLQSYLDTPHTFYITFIDKVTDNLDTRMKALIRTMKTDSVNPPDTTPAVTITPNPEATIIPTIQPVTTPHSSFPTPVPTGTSPNTQNLPTIIENYGSLHAEYDLNLDGIVNFADIL